MHRVNVPHKNDVNLVSENGIGAGLESEGCMDSPHAGCYYGAELLHVMAMKMDLQGQAWYWYGHDS